MSICHVKSTVKEYGLFHEIGTILNMSLLLAGLHFHGDKAPWLNQRVWSHFPTAP